MDDSEFLRLVYAAVRRATARLDLPPSVSYEDVYQPLVMKILPLLKGGKLNEVKNVRAWLYVAASHEARRVIMKEERLPHVALEEVPDLTTPSRLMDASQIERGLLLREIREELDEDERQLLSMMMHQYTFRQMADRLDISHVTASRRVNLLKAKIREHLFPTGSGRHPR